MNENEEAGRGDSEPSEAEGPRFHTIAEDDVFGARPAEGSDQPPPPAHGPGGFQPPGPGMWPPSGWPPPYGGHGNPYPGEYPPGAAYPQGAPGPAGAESVGPGEAGFDPGLAGYRPPLCTIFEEGDALRVLIELPGVEPEDLDVQLGSARIIVTTEAPIGPPSPAAPGRFYGELPLPADVDPDAVESEYRNGLLSLKLPKAAGSATRKLDVS